MSLISEVPKPRDCRPNAVAMQLLALFLMFSALTPSVLAEEVEDYSGLRLSLPFAFYNETFGLSAGLS